MGTKHRGKRMFYYKYFTLNKMKEVHIMSKKILKRSLALGVLMAFVITGNVWAGNVGADENAEAMGRQVIAKNASPAPFDNKSFKNIDEGKLQGGAIYNQGNITVSNSDFIGNVVRGTGLGSGAAIANMGGTLKVERCYFENNSSSSTKRGYGNAVFLSGGTATFTGNVFKNNQGGRANGLIYAYNGANVTLDGNFFENNQDSTMLNIQSGASLTLLNRNEFKNNAGNDIFVRGTATFAEESTTILEGGAKGLGIGDGAVVTMEEGSILTAKNGVGIDANASKYTGLLNMNEGSVLELGANSQIANLNASNATIKYLEDIDVKVYNNTSTNLNLVVEDGTITDAVNGDIEKLIGDDFAASTANDAVTTFSLAEGSVVGQVDGTLEGEQITNDDGTTKFIYRLKSSTEAPHEGNAAISNNANIAMMAWRAETNDMNKRLGELRNANGDLGVWVRMVGGEDEFKSVNHEYTQYQLGYDEKLSVDPSWTVGVALTYTDGESTFANGSGENTHKGLSVYGSKLNDDGSFIDLIAKYSRLEHDLTSNSDKGDYSTNGYSVSAEYGKRFQQGKGLWIEPQVELTYGKVKSAEYKLGDKTVSQDAMESLVGRVGFSLGKDIKQGNVYARASYLYDFEGETNMAFANSGARREFKYDLGGGWWEVGVGANINLSKATYIYADVEKTFGGEVDTNWQWNLGVRYSF